MVTTLDAKNREFGSGEVVEPGVYIDVDSGAVIKVNERDELPDGRRIVSYRRRFRKASEADLILR